MLIKVKKLSKILSLHKASLNLTDKDLEEYLKKFSSYRYYEKVPYDIISEGTITSKVLTQLPTILSKVKSNKTLLGINKETTEIGISKSLEEASGKSIDSLVTKVTSLEDVSRVLNKGKILYTTNSKLLGVAVEGQYYFSEKATKNDVIRELHLEDPTFIRYDYVYNHQLSYYRKYAYSKLSEFLSNLNKKVGESK